MARDEIYTGIDVGSTTVRVVVGQRQPEGGMHIISAAETPSEGVARGVVTSIEDAVSSISGANERAERIGGMAIDHAAVSVGGSGVVSQICRGVVAVAKADREISADDVERALESAQTGVHMPNYDIVHILPRVFSVDNQNGIKDPVGMTGLRLEVEAQIILVPSAQVANLTKAIYRTGVDVDDMVLGVLAASEAVLTKRQKELGVAVINLGGATTSLIVLEEGDVVHTAVIPIGGSHVTNDIAIGLRTSIDTAEALKSQVGSVLPEEIGKREEVDLAQFGQTASEYVSKRYIAEIMQARIEEIFKMIDKELKQIGRSGLLPAGVVLTGGGARIPGIVETGKDLFRLPTSVGYPKVPTAIEKVQDPLFSTAVGLVLWNSGVERASANYTHNRFSSVSDVTGKMKSWFRNLIP